MVVVLKSQRPFGPAYERYLNKSKGKIRQIEAAEFGEQASPRKVVDPRAALPGEVAASNRASSLDEGPDL